MYKQLLKGNFNTDRTARNPKKTTLKKKKNENFSSR